MWLKVTPKHNMLVDSVVYFTLHLYSLLFSQSLLTLDLIEDILEDQALKNVATGTESRKIALASSEEIEVS